MQGAHPGRYWHPEGQGDQLRFVCDLCPRTCKLHPGQRGFCYVRQASDSGIDLVTYGRSSGFCLDPIEKKPLNHFYPGTSVLSFGTAGCNLGCKFCQNWDISKARTNDRLQRETSPKEIAEMAHEQGAKSVAFTYNDPVIFLEYAVDTATECRKRGIKTVAVTAGYITEQARGEFFEAMDATNIDLKGFTEEFYFRQSAAHLKPVLDTLEYVATRTKTWLEITTLLIPGLNDSETELEAMTKWYVSHLGRDVPLHFSAFHPDFQMQDREATPYGTLHRAREIARDAGVRFVYTGNVHDREGQSTYCPGCRALVIERDWYELGEWNLKVTGGKARCGKCDAEIAGHFEDRPGHWGSRRVPV
jgi:pyruvate formate lyase activating enzyme